MGLDELEELDTGPGKADELEELDELEEVAAGPGAFELDELEEVAAGPGTDAGAGNAIFHAASSWRMECPELRSLYASWSASRPPSR